MPDKRRRAPAEKKALSYAKDRRGDYCGNNEKLARKSVPKSKAGSKRADRRKASENLAKYETLDKGEAELVENEIVNDVNRAKRFKKGPGVPLGEAVKGSMEARVSRVNRKQR
ncbi:hypothetical protein [Erythrobacter sp. SD-21]|uniref:hypothetical protein n=1 Tax=Erythrobacter sp. SD-21 TaxID=161528 RepID=UPI0012EAD456|nr:hypothetical protein [Erythrobacter sp. SD-21]